MYTILSIGKSGLNSTQNKMDMISDELANINTPGYKRKEISFKELFYNEIYDNEVLKSQNINRIGINSGSRSDVGTINFIQGPIRESTGEFHMAINGNGFFGVRNQEGTLMLTRNGGFNVDGDRRVSDNSGYLLDIDYYVPVEEWGKGKINISYKGEISIHNDGQTQLLGKIILYNPEVLDSLISLGEGRYSPSPNVRLISSIDEEEGFGDILQNYIEDSNVDITDSMMDMITAQRSYSLNAKSIQTTDDIMSMINNIKR